MGKKAVEIAGLDTKKLIELLNAALCEEWLAYYQYWVGASVVEGPMRSEVEPELTKHAGEEFGHAEKVLGRLIQLGGTPVLNPKDWFAHAGCEYAAPEDPYIEKILHQNLEGERCAIERYQQIAAFTDGKDFATYSMAVDILKDELEHEHDLEDWMTDIAVAKKHVGRN